MSVSNSYCVSMCPRYREDEFCNICARFIMYRLRRPITTSIMEMYMEIYDLEMQTDFYAPSIICCRCKKSIEHYVQGTSNDLIIKMPARWGDCRSDHTDCFYHLVKVNLGNFTTSFPRGLKVASYSPPIYYSQKR